MIRFRTTLALMVACSVALSACQAPKAPPATRVPSAAKAQGSPVARGRDSGFDSTLPTPTIPVAAPSVNLVSGGKVEPAQPAVHVFLWGEADTTSKTLQLAKNAGFKWVKQRFEWRNIEKTRKDAFEWYEAERIVDAVNKSGLGLVARIDNQPAWARRDQAFPKTCAPEKLEDWKDFVQRFAEHFKGKVAAYEIWNEPNLAREWCDLQPDPRAYTELLKIAYTEIKKVDPTALIISAGMSPTTEDSPRAMPAPKFIEGMYANGAKGLFDMLGANAPGFKATPEADPDQVAQDQRLTNNDPSSTALKRAYAFRHVEDLRAVMVKNGEDAKQIAIMEMGWTADPRPNSPYAWHSVSEQEKGDYIVRALDYAKKSWPWIAMVTVVYIPSSFWTASDEQYYWSITNPDGSPRPAYTAIKGKLNP